jgi:sugar O-acyltransferase (sialic acid O-acetyltransferase NeuD family)
MIIAGAGGHALEVLDILRRLSIQSIAVYGEHITPFWPSHLPSFSHLGEVKKWLNSDPSFVLGVGSSEFRKKLFDEFSKLGGQHQTLRGSHAVVSPTAVTEGADVFTSAFVGASVQIGLGVLINVGAQLHHEVKVGEFTVINPGALLLGGCEVGSGCFIGANATVLPGVRVGEGAIVGAGSVIIRDVPAGVTVVGVPGRITSFRNKHSLAS